MFLFRLEMHETRTNFHLAAGYCHCGVPICTISIQKTLHTAGSDTIFIQIYMDTLPGVPGVSKELEGHKDQYLDVFLR